MSLSSTKSQPAARLLPLEPSDDRAQQAAEIIESRLMHRLGIQQLSAVQPRVPVQHEAEDQDDLPAIRKLILVMQRRHGLL